MGLKENLLRGIYAFGFEKPSAIQQRAIIPCTKSESGGEKYEINKLTVLSCSFPKMTLFRLLFKKQLKFLALRNPYRVVVIA